MSARARGFESHPLRSTDKFPIDNLIKHYFCLLYTSLLNAFVLLPAYAALFGGMDAIIGMGTAVNKNITSVQSFVLLSVVPFNLVKGVIVSLVTFLLYKHVSRVLIHNA